MLTKYVLTGTLAKCFGKQPNGIKRLPFLTPHRNVSVPCC